MTEITTHTLEVPGAVLTYDVRPGRASGDAPLLLIGSPMGASGFAALAEQFPDRTVITYDPRGAERSARSDPKAATTPDVHAADVYAVIEATGGGPVDIFASSGGAVVALALVAAHPDTVRTLVAHEPPTVPLLPDADAALAACRTIHETYLAKGFGAGMAQFIALVMHKGPIAADFGRETPDPAQFGLPTEDDGNRDDLLLGTNMRSVPQFRPDADKVRAASTRVVVGVGAESKGEMAHRGGEAVAELLGVEPLEFPGGHAGFVESHGPEGGDAAAFAVRLREVLA